MNDRWRILVGADVNPNPNSGAAGTVIETNKALSDLGHQVEAFWSDSLGRRFKHGNLHYFLELPRAYRREVRRRLHRQRADVVQLSQPYAYLAGKYVLLKRPETLMVWRSHGLEAKVDVALHTHVPESGSSWRAPLRLLSNVRRRRVQWAAVRWSDGIIVPCQDDKEILVTKFGADPDHVRVIWHGVPDDYIDTPVENDVCRWRRILHVSQLSANKGNHVLFEVAKSVLERVPQAEMTWVCPGNRHELIRKALAPHIAARVRLLDWVPRRQLRDIYDAHGIFLFPTLAEGAAKSVMEALARGMCVVSSDTSGPRDYIQHGVNGGLVPVADATGMSRFAVQVLLDQECAARMGAAARRTANAFRWSRCATEMISFYSDIRTRKTAGNGYG